MTNFFERENENLDKLNNSYPEELRNRLTYDGLMIASIIQENPLSLSVGLPPIRL